MRGRQLPRRYTPPLVQGPPGPCGCGCALDEDTSYGYDVVDFAAEVLGLELDPWQRWLLIHACELLPDDRPRFEIVLTIVARQNGKTFVAKPLLMYWLFIEGAKHILGTSTDRTYAKMLWNEIRQDAKDNPLLGPEITGERLTSGEEHVSSLAGGRYKFAPNTSRAGRSLTVRRWLCDELRQHLGNDTWSAVYGAMAAVPDRQVFAITNQGDTEAVKLHELHDSALGFLETGQGDPRLGLFEWSAPEGSDPADPEALAYANPAMGGRIDVAGLVAEGERAKATGGKALSDFLVERMCMRVTQMVSAFHLPAWTECGQLDADDDGVQTIDLAPHRDRVALCFDVALDNQHATLLAAAEVDGIVKVDVVAAWDGPYATRDMAAELPGYVNKIRPRVIGWFPGGPAGAVAAKIRERKGGRWTPRGTDLVEITTEATVACMGVADLVATRGLRHSNDPLLDQHIEGTTPSWRGDSFLFQRRGRSSIDAAYALAGAVHLARTLPAPRPPLAVA